MYYPPCKNSNFGGTNGLQGLKLGAGFTKRANFLRNCAFFVEADCDVTNWVKVEEELYKVLKLRGKFTLLAISKRKALLEFGSAIDRDSLLDEEELYLSLCNLKGRRWTPRFGTNSPEMLKSNDRWVQLSGVLLHLWSFEIFESIVSNFGKAMKVENLVSDAADLSIVRVLVSNCNPRSCQRFIHC